MFAGSRQIRDIDRTLTRSALQAAEIVARLGWCPNAPDDEQWNTVHAVMRGLTGVLADQDRLLDLRLTLTP